MDIELKMDWSSNDYLVDRGTTLGGSSRGEVVAGVMAIGMT